MAELFDAITIECEYSADVWTDITADRLKSPAARGHVGMTDNGWLDHVGDAGWFTFSLDNSEGNSHATRGYYSVSGGGYI